MRINPMLCFVTHVAGYTLPAYLDLLEKVILGGVTHVQFRAKSLSRFETYIWAHTLKKFLNAKNIPFLINDNVALADVVGADGVHLGQTDGSPDAARLRLGSKACIGLSIESLDELHIANQLDSIDYVAASAVFPTPTKNNCKKIWGIHGLKQVVQQSKHPVIAIGGIHTRNIARVMEQGVSGVAVVSAIQASNTIILTTKLLKEVVCDAT
ncbi:MAG: thiamine phosphate synthase [Gammaproteobacteria bacterium]|nr:thiamine phosphate synthase [Gammaproteobacteria bacterium]MCH9762653.1 thiamine phosphate synthase [Gammaproteobacteria bacterium]